MQFIVAPPHPAYGQTVAIYAIATDPDNSFVQATCGHSVRISYGDGKTESNDDCYAGARCRPALGPWTPPAPEAGQYGFDLNHAFAAPGTYTVSVDVLSNRYAVSMFGTNDGPGDSQGRCLDPYASAIHGETTITVYDSAIPPPTLLPQ